MKLVHNIKLSVFSKEDEDKEKIKSKLLELVPFDMDKEKIILSEQITSGFNERKISIFEIMLKKEKHTNAFLNLLKEKLTEEQKQSILRQKDSRLDDDLFFFLRFDRQKLIEENQFELTDKGDCYHAKFSIAAFPAKKEIALNIINKIFK